ncbi:hypothetical protein I5E65_14250 [Pseudomonas aeruginosa]|nr:hypothetical protein [Pseudomonas aeruginosa]
MFSMNMNVPFVKERSEGIVRSSKNRNSRYLLLSFSLAALSSMSGVAFADETGYTTNDEVRSVESSLNNRIDRASTTLDNKLSQVASDVAGLTARSMPAKDACRKISMATRRTSSRRWSIARHACRRTSTTT